MGNERNFEDGQKIVRNTWAMHLDTMSTTQPKNGLIKTYENSSRTFSRPYSAKTVYFYKENDVFFTGVRVPISKNRYKTFESLLDDLNHQIYMPFGVRNITTPMGNTEIDNLNQLTHLGKYVASSSKPPRGVDLDVVERMQQKMSAAASTRAHHQTAGGQSYWVPASPSLPQKMRMRRILGLNMVSAKQVFFVLNGKGKFYRTLINPMKLPTMDKLLEEVSEGLQSAIFRFYTPDGSRISTVEEILSGNSPKIIACPRNERPFFETSVKLPEIRPSRYAPRAPYPKSVPSSTFSSNTSGSTSTGSNNVEKRDALPSIRKKMRKSTAAAPTKPSENMSVNRVNKKKSMIADRKLPRHHPPPTLINGEKKAVNGRSSNNDKDSGTGNSIRSWPASETPSESERAESMTERKAQMIREETHGGIELHSEEDLILEEESDYDHPAIRDDTTTSGESETIIEKPNDQRKSESRQSQESSAFGKSDEENSEGEIEESDKEEILESELENDEDELSTELIDSKDRRLSSPNIQTPSTIRSEIDQTPIDSPYLQTPPSPDEVSRSSTAACETPETSRSIIASSMPVDDEARQLAATRIQSVYRGFKVRKTIKDEEKQREADEQQPNVSDDVEAGKNVLKSSENEKSITTADESTEKGLMTYTIEIRLGFRYGADTEAELYLFLHGDDGVSRRIVLKQEADWLLTPHAQFSEGSSVRFFVESQFLGTLTKIVIGHDRHGYGAGLHIEHVMIAENSLDGRQFMFFVNKWFDGGQVDGKIERTIFLSTFLYMNSKPIKANAITLGRWEFILHTRKDDLGGTTSNITIVGYGDHDNAVNFVENDRMLRDFNLNPLIQVDFGTHIGQLQKVRFEIDGAGDQPNYFLEYIEVRDLDTDERSAVSINKWLMIVPDEKTKKYQPFREITIYRKTDPPLPMTTYEGRVVLADSSLCTSVQSIINLQLIGIHSQSGLFPVLPTKLPSGKMIYTFKIEMVSLGTIIEVRVIPEITDFGKDILDGFSILQDIYEHQNLPISVGKELFINEISIRETNHAPFRHIFGVSAIRHENNNTKGPYFKTLLVKVIEGLSTTKKLSKNDETELAQNESKFVLHMSVEDSENCQFPTIILCSKKGVCYPMIADSTEIMEGGVITYHLNTNYIGLVEKIRVGIDELSPGKSVIINKIRLVELITGTEIRFLFFSELRAFEIVEMMCVYPDVAPKISLVYLVQFKTIKNKGKFRPFINIIGTDGDTGFRAFPGLIDAQENEKAQMEVEALKLGTLKRVQIRVDGEGKINWKMEICILSEAEQYFKTEELTIKQANKKIEAELVITTDEVIDQN